MSEAPVYSINMRNLPEFFYVGNALSDAHVEQTVQAYMSDKVGRLEFLTSISARIRSWLDYGRDWKNVTNGQEYKESLLRLLQMYNHILLRMGPDEKVSEGAMDPIWTAKAYLRVSFIGDRTVWEN